MEKTDKDKIKNKVKGIEANELELIKKVREQCTDETLKEETFVPDPMRYGQFVKHYELPSGQHVFLGNDEMTICNNEELGRTCHFFGYDRNANIKSKDLSGTVLSYHWFGQFGEVHNTNNYITYNGFEHGDMGYYVSLEANPSNDDFYDTYIIRHNLFRKNPNGEFLSSTEGLSSTEDIINSLQFNSDTLFDLIHEEYDHEKEKNEGNEQPINIEETSRYDTLLNDLNGFMQPLGREDLQVIPKEELLSNQVKELSAQIAELRSENTGLKQRLRNIKDFMIRRLGKIPFIGKRILSEMSAELGQNQLPEAHVETNQR